jgi:hypothetical protein
MFYFINIGVYSLTSSSRGIEIDWPNACGKKWECLNVYLILKFLNHINVGCWICMLCWYLVAIEHHLPEVSWLIDPMLAVKYDNV